MHWAGWVTVALAVIQAGWMTFDGSRALIVGDYVTPQTGEYAGQLGPWALVVKQVGIEPRSTLMKSVFVCYGVLWLGVIGCFCCGLGWAKWAMLTAALGSLWYLPIGTLLSALQLGFLTYLVTRP